MRILSIIHMTGHVPHKTTKEKIFYAARVLFARKGFAATLTREIAAEAGVNLALINYYFKSKENLYHIITIDNLKRFRQTMIGVVNDHTTTLDEKLNGLTANYINLFLEQPDLPLFLVNEVGKYPKEFITHMGQSATFSRSAFYKQMSAAMKKGKIRTADPLHVMLNIVSLAIFPFVAAPLLQHRFNLKQAEFKSLMLERKRLIPAWMKAMLEVQ